MRKNGFTKNLYEKIHKIIKIHYYVKLVLRSVYIKNHLHENGLTKNLCKNKNKIFTEEWFISKVHNKK